MPYPKFLPIVLERKVMPFSEVFDRSNVGTFTRITLVWQRPRKGNLLWRKKKRDRGKFNRGVGGKKNKE